VSSENASIVQTWLADLDKQRRELKMTLPALAQRARLSRATVRRLLIDKRMSASLDNVLAIADALGAKIGFHIQSPKKLVEREVQERAKRIVQLTQGTMALEAQGLTEQADLDELLQSAAKEIRARPRKHLWMK
jgi:transcriptional regulator with XRE-family HTH domain